MSPRGLSAGVSLDSPDSILERIHIEDTSNVGQGRERSFLVYQSNLLDEVSSPVTREVANRSFSMKVVNRIDHDVENGKLEIKEKSIRNNMIVTVHNKALLSGIAYCISSCSMILVNKYVLSCYNFNAGISLMLYQNFVAVVVVSMLSFLCVISTEPLTLRLIKIWLPVNVIFVGMLITSMFSLKYINVAMVTVLKNVTNVITAVGEMYIFNRHHDSRVWTALFLMIVSAVSGGITDLSFHATGYTWQIINCFLTASYSIDSDASKRSTSHSIEKEEERQWKEAWSQGHKPETGIHAMHRGGPFWGKVREAAEKKILKENLLAVLSSQSGVQYDPSEDVMMAARHIADQRRASSGAGPSHIPRSSDYASSSIPNRMTCVEENLDHIRHFQAYQVKHNQAVAEMLRAMALHYGMNMDKFPSCPSYMPPRDKEVLDDDDDDDDDDADEDEDEEEEDEE